LLIIFAFTRKAALCYYYRDYDYQPT